MLIRNKQGINLSVSPGHQYTVEKVRKAMEFINHTGRNTTVQEWVEMYNYIKGTNESAVGCKSCAAAKYTASVRNYAHFGYLTLLNEGHKPEEFGIGVKKVQEPVENEEKRIVLEDKVIEEVKEALTEQASDGEVVEDVSEDKPEEEEKSEEEQEKTSDCEDIENVSEQEKVVENKKPKRGRKASK